MSRRRGGFSAFQQNAKKEEATLPVGPTAIGESALKKSQRPVPNLSVEDTKALLESMRKAVIQNDFQESLTDLRGCDMGAFKKRTAVAKMLGMAWKTSLRSFGFSIDEQGFPQVLATIRNHFSQPGIRTSSEEIERTLKFFPGALFGSKAGELKQTKVGGAFSNAVADEKLPIPGPASTAGTPQIRGRPINMGEAKEMLKAFKEVASGADFQRTIESMFARGPTAFGNLLPTYVGVAWGPTLQFFDFPAKPEGFQEVFQGISKHGWNIHVKTEAHAIERLLRVPLGSTFFIPGDGDDAEQYPSSPGLVEEPSATGDFSGATAKPQKRVRQPSDVEVVVSHAVHGTSIKVYVPASSSFIDIKDAVAELLGRDEILTRGKLVKRNESSGVYAAYKDSDPIGDLRNIQVLGADLTLPKGAQASSNTRSTDQAPNGSPKNRITEDKKLFPTHLTLQQAFDLQQDLHAGFSQPDFQIKLKQINAEFQGTRDLGRHISEHVLSVQKLILPKYGFQGSTRGVYDMMEAFEIHNVQPEIKKRGDEINKLLQAGGQYPFHSSVAEGDTIRQRNSALAAAGISPDDENASDLAPAPPKPAKPEPPPPPREIRLHIRHATKPTDFIQLQVMTDWTFKKVKDALAELVMHDDVLRKAKFVHRPAGSDNLKNFAENVVIGDRSELLCLGLESLNLVDKAVEISVQHAIDGGKPVPLKARTSWTFKEVREALAKRVGSDEIRNKGRFVFKAANDVGSWLSYTEKECLGERRKLHLLGCDLPRELKPETPTEVKPEMPTEVEVNVKHVRSGEQVQVTVLSTATMRDVRHALAKHVGRMVVFRDGTIVQPQGHAPYADSDLLGKRRRLLFIGPEFSEAKEEAEDLSSIFSLQDAHALLALIRKSCSQPDVQEKASDPLMVGEAFMDACAGPAAESGFGTGESALRDMFAAVKSFIDDPVVQDHLNEIEKSLHLPDGSVVVLADSMTLTAC